MNKIIQDPQHQNKYDKTQTHEQDHTRPTTPEQICIKPTTHEQDHTRPTTPEQI